jgi:hypothetical protein
MDYQYALMFDLLVTVSCMVALSRFGDLKHSHPATSYLVFHLFTFTTRLVKIWLGAPTLFTEFDDMDPVRESEIVRAMFWGDIAFFSMSMVWIALDFRSRSRPVRKAPADERLMNPRIVWAVTAIAFPIGLFTLLRFGSVPGAMSGAQSGEAARQSLGEWGSSSWLMTPQSWPGLCLVALIYVYGFRLWLMLPMAAYLGLMTIQGYHRFRVVVPLILLMQIWLDGKGKRWPGALLSTGLIVAALAFLPMKVIGREVQNGASLERIGESLKEQYREFTEEDTGDHLFLDQFACTLTLVDQSGTLAWGHPYYAMLMMPVPRQFWHEKPSIADYLDKISTFQRPMREMGMITTYLGEAYANFGSVGIVIIPALLAFALGRASNRSEQHSRGSIARFSYLVVASNLLQVYRDGLVSLFVFTFVNMTPLLIILLLHALPRGKLPARVVRKLRPAAGQQEIAP